MGNIFTNSDLLNDDAFRFVRESIEDASVDDHEEDFRTETVEFVNDASYEDEDEFFYDMVIYARFYDYDKPARLKDKIAYTAQDGRIYLNAPGNVGKDKNIWEFIFDHECLHQLWNTFGVKDEIIKKGHPYNHQILNIASDCVINHYLRDLRKKQPFKDGIFPETIEKECGVKYDYKYDDQFSLYLKLLEHKDKLKKLIPKTIKFDDQVGGAPPTPPAGQFSDDFKRGWSDAITDVVTGKVDPLKYPGKVPTNDYEAGYESAMGQMKEGLENGITLPKKSSGAQDTPNDGDGLRQIPWETPPDDSDGGDGGSGEGGDSDSSQNDQNGQSDQNNQSNQPSDVDPDQAAKNAQDSANKAKDAANRAKDAADKAQSNGDKDAQDKRDAAKKASDAAKKAQDAADKAKDAAKDGDRGKANKAADDAKNAEKEAQNAADKAEGKDAADKADSKDGSDKPGSRNGKGGNNKRTKYIGETAEDIAKIKGSIKDIIDKYSNVLSGNFGTFIKKCKSAVKCHPSGLAQGTIHKAAPGWDQQMTQSVVKFTKGKVAKKKRQYEESYERLDRRSGVPKLGTFIKPGDRIKNNKLTINAAFYVDCSGSMGMDIDNVWEACYILAESLKKRFKRERVIDKFVFKIFAFDMDFREVEFGKRVNAGGGTMPFQDLLNGIIERSNDYLINIIITDAEFQDVDEKQCKQFIKKINGMINFITNSDNYIIKKIQADYKNKFFYILANSNFKLSK